MNKLLIAGGILFMAAGQGVAQTGSTASFGTSGRHGPAPSATGGAIGFPTLQRYHMFGSGFISAPFQRTHDRSHRFQRGHRGHFRGFDQAWGYWGDGDGYVNSDPAPDTFGFFATGGEVELIDDQPVYDYDRSYPYDWYRGDARPVMAAASDAPRPYRCEVTWVPDEARGQPAPVRICRR